MTSGKLAVLGLFALAGCYHYVSEDVNSGTYDRVQPTPSFANVAVGDSTAVIVRLVNPFENALKYSPKEPVRVQVAETPSRVLVRVVDHGPGVAMENRERIFEPFQRGDDGTRGAGLGLAIARGFAEANDASVWAESRPGQGATFVLALPAAGAV